MVFNPEGKALAFIRLPERCAISCFGGPKNNRLYMASCHPSTRLRSARRGVSFGGRFPISLPT